MEESKRALKIKKYKFKIEKKCFDLKVDKLIRDNLLIIYKNKIKRK